MFQKNKLIFPILILSIFLLAGCGLGKNAGETKTGEKGNGAAESVKSEDNANLPQPTGKVGDIVRAIDDETAKEQSITSEEDGVAKSSFDSTEETSDLNQTYDENEL